MYKRQRHTQMGSNREENQTIAHHMTSTNLFQKHVNACDTSGHHAKD